MAADLDAYKRGRLDWASIDKGLLLEGPPGVGKTQYAKALARTARIPIIATSGADWNAANYLSGTLQFREELCCDPFGFLQMKLESGPLEGPDDEAIEVYGRADHCRSA